MGHVNLDVSDNPVPPANQKSVWMTKMITEEKEQNFSILEKVKIWRGTWTPETEMLPRLYFSQFFSHHQPAHPLALY